MDAVSATRAPVVEYALSLKQPWAALVAHGLKTIEVRRWPTARRGRVLIHAARIADPRVQGWSLVPAKLRTEAEIVGGIVGAADLVDCLEYRDLQGFAADQKWHLNDPEWFEFPLLYGFRFANMAPLPFRAFPGWVRFFPVADKFLRPERKTRKSRP